MGNTTDGKATESGKTIDGRSTGTHGTGGGKTTNGTTTGTRDTTGGGGPGTRGIPSGKTTNGTTTGTTGSSGTGAGTGGKAPGGGVRAGGRSAGTARGGGGAPLHLVPPRPVVPGQRPGRPDRPPQAVPARLVTGPRAERRPRSGRGPATATAATAPVEGVPVTAPVASIADRRDAEPEGAPVDMFALVPSADTGRRLAWVSAGAAGTVAALAAAALIWTAVRTAVRRLRRTT